MLLGGAAPVYTPDRPGLIWNRRARKYRGSNGRFLSPIQIRNLIDNDIRATKEQMAALFARLQAGELELAEWRLMQARLIKHVHIANYALSKGGFHNLTSADLGRIGAIVKKQYAYLNRFAVFMGQRPEVIGNRNTALRNLMYADAGRITYEAARHEQEVSAGARWARRIPHSSEACPDCAAVQYQWIRIEDFVPIGGYQCNIHCLCTVEYWYGEEPPG